MLEIRHFTPVRFGDPLLEIRIARGVRSYPASLKWLLGGFALLCLCVAGAFALKGAVPVLGFAGLEVILLFVLLRISFRRAAGEEDVCVAGDATVVHRDGTEAARLQSYWLQVDPAERGIVLRSRGQKVAVGAGLATTEVSDLASAMRVAIHQVRSAPTS
jgi:uncharacterized membrane protein